MAAVLDPDTYRKIYRELKNREDIDSISKIYGIDKDTIIMIFNQKEVRRMIDLHREMVKKKMKLLNEWKKGMSIVEIAEKENFSPMLMVQIILMAMNISKRKIKKMGL